jgi:hypothetical protein
MNRKLFILVLLLGIYRFAYSQPETFSPEWAFGVNGGTTFSKVDFTSSLHIPEELLQQYSGGLTVRYVSEKTFGIQGELNYSLRGWQEKTDSVHLNKYALSIAYLELPVLTHIYFDLGKRSRLVFNLGPQIGFNIGQKTLTKEINDAATIPDYYDRKIQRKFDYGIRGGMGLEIRTGVGSFVLEGKYYFGLSDIFNNTRGDTFQSSSNQIIGINLTYLFRTIKSPSQPAQ